MNSVPETGESLMKGFLHKSQGHSYSHAAIIATPLVSLFYLCPVVASVTWEDTCLTTILNINMEKN